jgi:hypothetical protein
MSSGDKELVVNPLERAVSTDIMRAQAFKGALIANLLQAFIDNAPGSDDVQAGAQYNPNIASTAGTPTSGIVYAGLLFQPMGGSTAAGISAGIASIYDPDTATTPSSDDSQYKIITDPGTVTNTLVLTPNSSGSLRIDIVECNRVQPDNVIETDSRDIFNTVTGLFAAATVNKVTAAQFQYRIRAGTPGGGFPALAQGWMPLAVASVPTGTTVWDTVTIWDVRPLFESRLFEDSRASRDQPFMKKCSAQIDALTTASQSRLTGNIEVEFLDRRYGGIMQSSCPQGTGGGIGSEADSLFIDLDDAQNRSASGTIGTTGLNYVYVCAPFGLPRWAKYTAGPAGRVPRSPRGIIVASATSPDYAYGTPHGGQLNLPPCLQNSGNTAVDTTTWPPRAVCVLARVGTSGSSPRTGGLVARGGVHSSNANVSSVTTTAAFGQALFTFTPGTDFPANARAIWVTFTGVFTLTGTVANFAVTGGTVNVGVAVPASGTIAQVFSPENVVYGAALSGGPNYSSGQFVSGSITVRVPIIDNYELIGTPGASTPGNSQTISVGWVPNLSASGGGSVTFSSATGAQSAQIQQWELDAA